MKTTELITIARKCGDRTTNCERECPMYGKGEDCTTRLLNALADKLEKAMVEINGVAKFCATCTHKGKDYRKPPCSLCKPLEYNKWQWRGDAE